MHIAVPILLPDTSKDGAQVGHPQAPRPEHPAAGSASVAGGGEGMASSPSRCLSGGQRGRAAAVEIESSDCFKGFAVSFFLPLSLSFSFSLPSLFIFPFRGWRVLIHWGKLWFWIIPVAGPVVSCRETFRLHFTNTIQVDIRQGMRLYSRERQRDVGRSIFGAFVPVCVLLCWSYTPYNLIWGSFLFSVCLFQCLWAHRTNLRHCAGTRIPENELPFSI